MTNEYKPIALLMTVESTNLPDKKEEIAEMTSEHFYYQTSKMEDAYDPTYLGYAIKSKHFVKKHYGHYESVKELLEQKGNVFIELYGEAIQLEGPQHDTVLL